ncbi:hypothetical protein LIER_42939 [Lithospermum erythrorhizon]|uniref:UBN2_3 domain-containing protein n=1 Tax=Lithospermum erythrorhizon TaxID=34254 RepID=A0AAV3P9Z7_LITER
MLMVRFHAPPSHIHLPNGPLVPNPSYDLWVQQDPLIMSLLISSLSEETIPLAVGKPTSHEIWTSLHTALANPSFSNHLCLQEQLISLKQNDQFITSYLKQAKGIFDALAAIGNEPSQETTFEELHNFLLTHDFVNPDVSGFGAPQTQDLLPTPSPIVQYASRDNGASYRGRGRLNQGCSNRSHTRLHNSDRRYQHSWNSRSSQE